MKFNKSFFNHTAAVFMSLLLVFSLSSCALTSGIAVLNAAKSKDVKQAYSECASKFQTFTYTDSQTGLSIPYALFIPENYDSSVKYPMISFIGDMGAVGKSISKTLKIGLGSVIWATEEEQQKHPGFVLLPQFPEVILDDHNGFTMTDYVELTAHLIEKVENEYSIDTNRVYGTGQSMGCMTTMYLAANHPDLFAAELFIDGQWDLNQLTGLTHEKFIYVAAGGDAKASAGQKEVKDYLAEQNLKINSISEVDAKRYADGLTEEISDFLSAGCNYNFITFKKDSVKPWYVSSSSDEHLLSFNYGYRLEAARDWLYRQ